MLDFADMFCTVMHLAAKFGHHFECPGNDSLYKYRKSLSYSLMS